MLAGKPIVSFQGAAKGVRHMYDAFIVPDHDCDALGKWIVTLLRNPTLAAQLGAQARATVLATFHWCHICVDIERIYHKLVEAANQQNRSAPSARKWANVLPVESANNPEFDRDVGFSRLSQPVENPAMINDKKGSRLMLSSGASHRKILPRLNTKAIANQELPFLVTTPDIVARQPLYAQNC